MRADTGQPLKGARVTLQRAQGRSNALQTGADFAQLRTLITNIAAGSSTVTTDANGRFSFTGVAPGEYLISGERDGFIRSEYGQRTPTGRGVRVPVSADQPLQLELKMLQASVVSGRVLTLDGEPAAQATVQAYAYRYSNGQRELAEVKDTRTNDLGEYRLFWLEPGDYFVSVKTDENQDGAPVGTVDVSQNGGRGERGTAGLQALVALGDRGNAITQALGGAQGENPPFFYPGTLNPDTAVPISVPAGVEVRGMDFNLQPVRAATVSGQVVAPFPLGRANNTVGQRGRGIVTGGIVADRGNVLQLALAAAGVQLNLSRVGSSRTGLGGLLSLRFGGTRVNEDGTFEIKGVAPGEYDLIATARDPNNQEYTARTRLTVGSADVSNIAVTLRPGVEIHGRFVLDGTPPQQFRMSSLRVSLTAEDGLFGGIADFAGAAANFAAVAANAGGRGEIGFDVAGGAGALFGGTTTQVADDGSFTIKNVGAMEYRLRVAGLPQGTYIQAGRIGSRDALSGLITVDNDGSSLQLVLGFSPGQVSGVVSDERGDPVPGVEAVLVPDPARRGRSDAYFTVSTDQNGQFTISNVPPGRYKLFSWEDIPAGAYQYEDFIRRHEDRGSSITVNPNGAVSVDGRLIRSN